MNCLTIVKKNHAFISKIAKSCFSAQTPTGSCLNSLEEFGQPTYWSHPHLFKKFGHKLSEQVTPGITRQEFVQRRENYATCLINFQRIYFSHESTHQEKTRLLESPFNLLHPLNSILNIKVFLNFEFLKFLKKHFDLIRSIELGS